MFFKYVLPFIFGLLLIGGVMERTLTVMKGDIPKTAFYSGLIGVVYWFNIQYIARGEVDSYVAFTLGTAVVTCWQAYREKHRAAPPANHQNNGGREH